MAVVSPQGLGHAAVRGRTAFRSMLDTAALLFVINDELNDFPGAPVLPRFVCRRWVYLD